MKKTIKFALAIMIAIMTVGVTQKATAQFSVQTFELKDPVAKQANELMKFYQEGQTIERTNSSKEVIFQMLCCTDNTIQIYFPKETKCNCPVLTLYQNDNQWRTSEMPANEDGIAGQGEYSSEQTDTQVKIINRAIALLKS